MQLKQTRQQKNTARNKNQMCIVQGGFFSKKKQHPVYMLSKQTPLPPIENQLRMPLKCHFLHWTTHSLHSNLIRHTSRKFLHVHVNLFFHELHLRLLLDVGLYGEKSDQLIGYEWC